MPSRNRKKRSKQRAEYLQKQDYILSQENKAKARARYKADPEKKKASVRDSYKADPEKKKASVRDNYKADPEKKKASVRDSYKADPEKKKASVRDSYKADPEKKKASVRDSYKADPEKKKASARDSYKADPEKKKASVRDSYNADIESKQSAKRQRYQEDLEENRTTKRQRYQEETALLKGRNTRTIQLPLRHLKGIGIGMTPLSDWLNVLPRGSGIAGVTELPLPPKAQKVVTRSARAAVSKIGADALVSKALSVRRAKAGSLLKTIREVNALRLEENDILVGHGYHTAGSEPYFFINSYTYTKRLEAIPVDLNGRCVVAEEIGDRDKDTMRPLKWKCTNECRKLTSEEVELVVRTKSLFQMSIEDLRAGLDGLDSGCSHVHTDITLKLHSGFIEQLGHPIYCELPECSSPLRVIRAAMPHFPVLRIFTRLLYKARKCHMTILAIDSALSCGNIDELIPFLGLKAKFSDLFSEDGVEHAVVSEDHSSSGLGCIERDLKVTHADLIAELQSKFNDDAEFACCSCERL
ncbi:hypothetical protein EMCRGX_G009739 [Ephydatia muelleri]